MKRLLLLTLAAAAAMSLLAIVGIRSLGGSTDVAHAGAPLLAIDLKKDGSTWCSPVDATFSRPVNPTGSYEIALCLVDATSSPAGFNLDVIYNDTLNNCPEVAPTDGTNLDDNPDANAGSVSFTTPNLGTGWDCNYGDIDPPLCDKDPLTGAGKGRAYMQCGCTTVGCATLAVGAGTSKPIAVITMKAIAAGADSISLDSVSIINEDGIEFVNCYGGGPCQGAVDTKTVPPTPTSLPPECDIKANGLAANPASLNLKVGDKPPAIVNVTGTWTNLGSFHQGVPGLAARVGYAWGAMALTAVPGVFAPIPAGLSVRVEPFGAPLAMGAGDVCLVCNPLNPAMAGKAVGECLQGPGPYDKPAPPPDNTTWWYNITRCDESTSTVSTPARR